jgi:hypothetical protein
VTPIRSPELGRRFRKIRGTIFAATHRRADNLMAQSGDPDTKRVRAEVGKSVKTLQEQKELLYHRMFAVRIRLKVLEAKMREEGKSFKDKN